MAKQYKVIVNTGKAENNKVLDIQQQAGDKGQPVRIKAQAGAKYQLQELTRNKNVAPDYVRAKRNGKNLEITFEDGNRPDLIIEDYYSEMPAGYNGVIGQAENGSFYEYLPEDPVSRGLIPELADGAQPTSVALGGNEVVPVGAAVGVLAAPLLAPLGLLGGAAAAAAAAAADGGTTGGQTSTTVTGALQAVAPNDSGTLGDNKTNDKTPTLVGTVPSGSSATVTINGQTYPVTVNADGTWSFTQPTDLPDGTYTPVLNVTTNGVTTPTNLTPFTIDTTPPTVVVTASATTLSAGQSATVTFTLSEASSDFVPEDITVTGGTLSNFVQSATNPLVYTATFTPTSGATSASIKVDSAKFTDAAANANADGAEANNTVTFSIPADSPTPSPTPTPTPTTVTGALQAVAPNDSGTLGDNKTNDKTPTLTGTAPAGATATVTINGQTYPVTIGANGTWTFTQPTNLPDGTYTPVLNVTQNGVTTPTNLTPFTIDTVTSVDITNPGKPGATDPISGTAEPGATVEVKDATGKVIGTTTAGANGQWSLTPTSPVPAGTITATATDAAGNTATDTDNLGTNGVKTALIIDPISENNILLLSEQGAPNYTVTGQVTGQFAAGDTVQLTLNGKTYAAVVDASGKYSIALPMSDLLADPDTKIEGTVTGTGGDTATAAQDYTTEAGNTPTKTALSLNPVTPDNILSPTEAAGTVAITGKVTGPFSPNDTVTVTVNGKTYTGKPNTDGTFSIPVPGSELAADPNTTIEAAITGTGGTPASAMQDYGLGNTTPTNGVKTALSLEPIATDNIVQLSEQGATTVPVKGKVTGAYAAGDLVTLSLNGKFYTATVGADGSFSAQVDMDDLKQDADTKIEGIVTGTGGDTATAAQDYTFEAGNTPTQTALSLNPVTPDNILSPNEATGTVNITGKVTGPFSPNDTVTVTVNGQPYTGKPNADGTFSIPVPGAALAADPNTTIEATITGTGGTPASAMQDYGLGSTTPTGTATGALSPTSDNNGDGVNNPQDRDNITKDPTPELSGTVPVGASATVTVAGQTYPVTVNPDGTWTFTQPTNLPDGTYYPVLNVTTDGVTKPTNLTPFTIDTTPPTVIVTSSSTALTPGQTATITFTLSEASSDFTWNGTSGDIAVTGGTLSALTQSTTDPKVYTATFTPASSGTSATISVASDKFSDAAGNKNTDGAEANNSVTLTTNATTTGALDPASDSGTQGDNKTNDPTPTLSGKVPPGSTAQVDINGTKYPVTVNPDGTWSFTQPTNLPDGTYTPQLIVTPQGSSTPNAPVPITPFTIDTTPPKVEVTSSAKVLASGQTAAITFTLTEASSDFTAADVAVTGGTLSNFQQSPTNPLVYTATFTPNSTGTSGTVSIASDKFADAAANRNTDGAEANNTVSLTTNAPVTGQLSPSSDNATGTPNDNKTNDPTPELTGKVPAGSTATVTINGQTYPVDVKPDGTYTFTQPTNLPDGTYTPVLNVTTNGQTTSTPVTPFTIDTTPPTVAITSPVTTLAAGQSTTLTFTLSEASNDFTLGDISVTGGSLSPLQQSATNPLVYTASFTAAANATTASVSIASNKFADAAGNNNTDGADTNNTWSYTVTPTDSARTALTIDPITSDNIISLSEGGATSYTVTGKVTGTFVAGDKVTLVLNGTNYVTAVAADGSYSISVAMSDLKADTDTKIEGSVTGTGGSPATAAQDYQVQSSTNPRGLTGLSIDPVTADNVIGQGEATGNITITGTVTGVFSTSDTVTLSLNGKTYTAKPAADGSYSVSVPAAELVADPDTQIEGTITGTGGSTADALQNYAVNPNIGPDPSNKTALFIDPISSNVDNILSQSEQGNATTIVSGFVSGAYAAGDKVTLTINGTPYTAPVDADGNWNVAVATADLVKDSDTKVEGTVTGTGGTIATAAQDYVVETSANTGRITALSIDPVTEDNLIDAAESGASTIAVTGQVTGAFSVNDTVTLTVNGKTFTGKPNAQGFYSINVPTAELVADADTTVDGTVTGTGGTVANALQNYALSSSVNPVEPTNPDPYNPANSGAKTAINIDPVTGDNVLATTESGTINVTGKVSGAFAVNDTVTLYVNGYSYTGKVLDAAGNYSIPVKASDLLSDKDTKIEADVTGTGGDKATAQQDYIIEANPAAPAQTTLTIDRVTGDNFITASEKTGSVNVTGTVGGKFAVGDTVTLMVNDKPYTGKVLSAAGNYSIAVPAADLLADSDSNIDGSVSGTGGTIATAKQNYAIEAPTPTGTTTGALSPTSDNNGDGVTNPQDSDNITKDPTPELAGTVPTGSTATVTIDNVTYPVTVKPDGTWTFTQPTNLPDGTYYPVLNVTTGGVTKPTNLTPFTIDTTPPTIAITSSVNALGTGQTATITFTLPEASSDFALEDIAVTNGTLSALTQSTTDPKVYTATFTPLNSSVNSATISVASDKFADAAGNLNKDGAEANNTVTLTTNATTTGALDPASDSGTQGDNKTNDPTPTLSGKVPPGSTAQVDINGTKYPVTVNPDGTWSFTQPTNLPDGTYTPQLIVTPQGSSTPNAPVPITPFTIDTTPPTVAITSSAKVLASGQTAAITFTLSEPSTDFGLNDVAFSGGTLSNFQQSPTNPLVYTATFTPNSTGTSGTVSIASDKFADAAANNNKDGAEANNTVSLTTNAPVTGQLSPASDNATGTPNDNKTNDPTPELTGKVPAGSTATVTINGQTYPVDVKPDGTYTFTQPTNLPDGTYTPVLNVTTNGQTSSTPVTPFTIDTTEPTIAISGTTTTLTAGQSTQVTFTLSEASSDFTLADISVTGGTLSALTPSATNPLVYTATFTAAASAATGSTVSLKVDSNKFSDAAGNLNADGAEANNLWAYTVTAGAPVTPTNPDPYNPANTGGKTAISIDPVTGDNVMAATDSGNINVTGKVSGAFAVNDTVTLYVNGTTYTGKVLDAAGNYSIPVKASDLLSDKDTKIEADVTGTGGDKATAAQDYIVEANPSAPLQTTLTIDPVTGDNFLAASEKTGTVNITGTVGGKFAAGDTVVLMVNGKAYTGQAAANGTYSIAVPAADVAADTDSTITGTVNGTGGSAANAMQNYAVDSANPVTPPTDTTPPTIVVARTNAAATTLDANASETITFTLSEASTTFDASDIVVTGGTLSNFTPVPSSGTAATGYTQYTAVFTPAANSSGTATIGVASGKFSDNAGNLNQDTYLSPAPSGATTESNNKVDLAYDTRNTSPANVDTDKPTVQVSIDKTALAAGQSATLSFILSEPSTDFSLADIDVITGGGTLSNLQAVPGSNGVQYTATYTAGTTGGTVRIGVDAGKFSDAAGNQNADTYKGSAAGTTAVSGTSAETNNWVQLTNTGSTDTTAPTVVVSRTGSGTVGSAGETVVFTLSEASTTFTASDVTVTGGSLTNWAPVAGSGGTQYTATFVPTTGSTGSATIAVASGVFTDASGNANTDTYVNPAPSGATYEANNQVALTVDARTNPAPSDTTAPTIAITADKTTLSAGQTATLTFTLSEASTDFIQNDVSVSGGTLSNWTQVNPTTWTATYTPTAGSTGTGSVSVASNTFSDAAANFNQDGADANNTVSFVTNSGVLPPDTTAPTIEVKRLGSGTLSGSASETIQFTLSEASKDFTLDDITVTGGSLSNLAAVPTSGSAGTGYTTYVATFKPASGSGTATIGVKAGKFSDDAGNLNKDTYDSADTYAGKVLEDNNKVDIAYNTLTPATDTTAPTVAVARAGSGTLAVNATETITFTLSEPSLTFDQSDVTVTGGTLSNWTMVAASGTPSTGYAVYTATFTPTAGTSGTANIGVLSDKFTDAAGNLNKDTYQSGVAGTDLEANNQVSIGFDTTLPSKDTTAPTVEVVRSNTGTITGPETIYFNFSEATTDFALTDITVSGGTMSNLVAVAGSGNKQYIATFTPTASSTGTAAIGVKAGTFSDAANNFNKDTFDANDSTAAAVVEANNQVSAPFDTVPPNPIDQTPPTVAISRVGTGAVTAAGETLVFVFSEPVTGFATTDIVDTSTGSAATNISNLQMVAGSGGTQYTATWTPPSSSVGNITLGIKANAFADATGNQNLDTYAATADSVVGHIVEANNQLTLNWNTDTTAPTVAVSSSATTLAGSNTATITFTLSEAGVDFTQSDVVVTGGTLSNFAQSSTNPLVYTATFTANSNSQGTATIGVKANAFKDLAGNANADDYTLTRGLEDSNNKVDISYDTRNGSFAVANDTGSTTEGASASTVATPVTGNVLSNDSSATTVTAVGAGTASGNSANVGATVAGTYGTLTLGANGSYSYVLDNSKPSVQALKDGEKVTEIFTYTASGTVSGATQTGTANLVVTITGTNDAPVAVADTASAVEAGGVGNAIAGTNPTGNVLTNDTDVDTGDTRTVSALNGSTVSAATATADTTGIAGTYGKLYIGTDGSYRYELDQTNAAVQARLPSSPALTETFTYTVRDAAGATSQQTLTVNINGANDAPTVSSPIADKTATAGTALTPFSVTSNFADVDTAANGETATYSATLADGSPLPSWLSINASTGQFSGTPPAGTPAGTISIKATRTDAGGLSASDTFDIVLAAAPDTTPPTVAISSNQATLAAGQTATITFTLSEASSDFTWNGTSGDITVTGGTLSALTQSSTDPKVYTATFTPAANASGTATIGVKAGTFKDGSNNFNLDTYDSTDTYAGKIVESNNKVDIGYNTSTTTFSAVNDTNSATEDGAAINGNVMNNDALATSITKVAVAGGTDNTITGGTTSASTTATSVAGTYGTLKIGADGSYTYTLDNTKAAVQALKAGATAAEVFTYTATDGSGTKTANLVITVNGANDAPVYVNGSLVNQSATIGSAMTYSFPTTAFTDVDLGDTATYSATLADGSPLPTWLSFNPATRTFSGTPPADSAGTISVKVTDTDSANASASGTFDIVIGGGTPTDTTPPTIAITSDKTTLGVGQTATITFTLSEASSDFTDADIQITGGGSLGTLVQSSTNPLVYTATYTPATNSTTPVTISVASDKFKDAAGNFNKDGADSDNSVPLSINTVPSSTNATATIDITSIVNTPLAAQSQDTGTSATDFITQDDTLVYKGTVTNWVAGLGDRVMLDLYDTSSSTPVKVGSTFVTPDSAGNWIWNDITNVRATGKYTLEATIVSSTGTTAINPAQPTTVNGNLTNGGFDQQVIVIDKSAANTDINLALSITTDANNNGTVGTTELAGASTFTSRATFDATKAQVGDKLTFSATNGSTGLTDQTVTLTATDVSRGYVDVTFTKPNDGATQTVTVNYTDAAGNVATDTKPTDNAKLDTITPTIGLSTSATTVGSGQGSDTATITFTLSEASTDFDLSDVAVTGGTLSNFAGSGTTYTATFMPTAGNTTGTVSVASGKFSDAGGNQNADGADTNNTQSLIINVAPVANTTSLSNTLTPSVSGPEVTITDNVSGAATNGQTVTYTLKFSEAIDPASLTASDLSVTNGTLVANSLTQVDATTWTVQATAPASGVDNQALTVKAGSYSNSSGVVGSAGTGTQTYGVSIALTGPDIDGPVGQTAPTGWSSTSFTPDTSDYTLNGFAVGSTGTTYYANSNGQPTLNGVSTDGGQFASFLSIEGITRSITGLTVGQTYTYGVEWQKFSLGYVNGALYDGLSDLTINIGGVTRTYTSDSLNDPWTKAYFTFTATSTSMSVTLGSVDQVSGKSGFIAVDSLTSTDIAVSGLNAGVSRTGTSGADATSLIGADGNDFLAGAGGADVIAAGGGNDAITLNSSNVTALGTSGNGMLVDGGTGINRLVINDAAATLDLTNTTVLDKVRSINTIDITGTGANTLKLDYRAVVQLPTASNQTTTAADEGKMLVVNGNAGDTLQLAGNWIKGSTAIAGNNMVATYGSAYGFVGTASYDTYTLGDATVFVPTTVTVQNSQTSTTAMPTPTSAAVTIESLFASTFSDSNTTTPINNFQGVAITSAGTSTDLSSKGKYQLSKDGGTTWIDVAAGLTDDTAIYAAKGDLIRFVGTSATANPQDLVVRLVDGYASSTLATGDTVDVNPNGGMTAYSGNTVTLTMAPVADTVKPGIVVTSSADTVGSGQGSDTATITFTLSEPSTNFDVNDVTVTGGTLSNFSGSGSVYTATFTPTAGNTTGTVSVASSKFSDAAGNQNADGAEANNTANLTINIAPLASTTSASNPLSPSVSGPEVTITDNVSGAATNGQTVTYTLKFSEAIDPASLTASDLSVTNGTLVANSLTQVDATTWTVQATAPASGVGTQALSVTAGSYTNAGGTAGTAGSATQTYGATTVLTSDIDRAAGTAEGVPPDGWQTIGGTPDMSDYTKNGFASDAVSQNLNGVSTDGGQFASFWVRSDNTREGISKTFTNLAVGTTYTFGVEWQRISVLTGGNNYNGDADLRITIGGVTKTYSSTGLSDLWTPAYLTFTATSTTMAVNIDSVLAGDLSYTGFRFVAVDSLSISQVPTDLNTDQVLTGTSSADTTTLIGADGNDTITAAGGADVIAAGGGSDVIRLNTDNVTQLAATNTMVVDGGSGVDRLVIANTTAGTGATLDLTNTAVLNKLRGIESIDITGPTSSATNNTLKLDYRAVTQLATVADLGTTSANESKMLAVNGNAGDTLQLAGTWTKASTATSGTVLAATYGSAYGFVSTASYDTYTLGDATVFVPTTMTVSNSQTSTTAMPTPASAAVTIESLFASTFSDSNTTTPINNFQGVAITSAGTSTDLSSKGKYQLSKDGGTTWIDVAAGLTDDTAIYAAKGDLIRFVGTSATATPQDLVVRLVDGYASSTLATGDTVDVNPNGGMTAYSGNTVTLTITPTIDAAPPGVVVTSSADTLEGAQTATITFSLSEPSTTFTQSSVNVTGGTLSNFTGSGSVYTATFTPTAGQANGSATISVGNAAFTDAAGNANADGAEDNNRVAITYNTLPQQVEIDYATTDALIYREEFNSFNSSSGLATNWTVTGKNTSTNAAYTLSANTPSNLSSFDPQVGQTLGGNDTTENVLRLGATANVNAGTASTYNFTAQTGTFNALSFSYAALDGNATVSFFDASGAQVGTATMVSGSGVFSHTLASGVMASSYSISTASSRYFYVDSVQALVPQDTVNSTETIRDTTPVLEGDYLHALAASDTIKIYKAGTYVGDAVIDPATKTWSFPLTSALASGSHDFVAKIVSSSGSVIDDSLVFNLNVASGPAPLGEITTTLAVKVNSTTATSTTITDDLSTLQTLTSKNTAKTSKFMFVDLGLDTQYAAATQIAVGSTGALANYGEFRMNPENTKTSDGTLETFRIVSLVGDVTRVQFTYGDLQDQNKTIKFFDASGTLISTQVLPLVGNGFNQPFDSGTFANGAKAAYWEISGGVRDLWAINSITVETRDTVQTVVNGGTVLSTTPQITGTLSRTLAVGEKALVFQNGVQVGEATVYGTDWTYNATIATGSTNTFQVKVQAPDGTIYSSSASPIQTVTQSSSGVTPLVLDLDGDGIETTTLAAGVAFDHLADGHAEQTAWVTGGDGLLVKDINLDGFINNGRELFGSGTLLPNGQNAADGFQALAGLDTNADGVINGLDADFASLKVWIDANNNGATDAGELQTLQALGIAELSLHAGTSELKDNGNTLGLVSNYTTSNGQTRALVDVWLQAEPSSDEKALVSSDSLATASETSQDVPEVQALDVPGIYTVPTAIDLSQVLNAGVADMANAQTEVLQLKVSDLLQLPTTDGVHQLQIVGDADDVVALSQLLADGQPTGTWGFTGQTVTQNGHTFNVVQYSGDQTLQVLIDQHIAQSNVHLS